MIIWPLRGRRDEPGRGLRRAARPRRGDGACAQYPAEPTLAALASDRPLRVAVLGGYFTHWAGPEARQAVQLAARALDATDIVELAGAQQRAPPRS